ncbi:AIFM1-like protein [Mya arenaria]|uniref:AIFM1-like protein n=1 Tax=Mya arenaria TaxID=6604 RepID=A0ABY7DME9_MYAAR|nr:AIFM1-like protein [Mya arenaria]
MPTQIEGLASMVHSWLNLASMHDSFLARPRQYGSFLARSRQCGSFLARPRQYGSFLAIPRQHDSFLARPRQYGSFLARSPQYGSFLARPRQYGSFLARSPQYGSFLASSCQYGSFLARSPQYGSFLARSRQYGSFLARSRQYGSFLASSRQYGSFLAIPRQHGSFLASSRQYGSFLARSPQYGSFLARYRQYGSFMARSRQHGSFLARSRQYGSFLARSPQYGSFLARSPQYGSFLARSRQYGSFLARSPQHGSFLARSRQYGSSWLGLASVVHFWLGLPSMVHSWLGLASMVHSWLDLASLRCCCTETVTGQGQRNKLNIEVEGKEDRQGSTNRGRTHGRASQHYLAAAGVGLTLSAYLYWQRLGKVYAAEEDEEETHRDVAIDELGAEEGGQMPVGSKETGDSSGNAKEEVDWSKVPDYPSHVPYLLIGGGVASLEAYKAIRTKDPTAKVLNLDSVNKTVLLENGVQIAFDKCLIATGAENKCQVYQIFPEKGNMAKVSVDHVVVAVGVEPNTELARSGALELDKQHGGFLVNSELQAKSDIYAETSEKKEDKTKRHFNEGDYGNGVIFYLKDGRVVGVVLWNLEGFQGEPTRIDIARQVIADGAKEKDLKEVAKLFNVYAD